MAKKKKPQAEKPRTDAERRARQCERLARVLRTLRLISGPGRWDVRALAEELECSERTVQRILQTLQLAGVPFRYDSDARAYKVAPNYRFPGLASNSNLKVTENNNELIAVANKVLHDGELFIESLRQFCEALKT
jgi:predicted DNA-binding transcriptional regulator YafY